MACSSMKCAPFLFYRLIKQVLLWAITRFFSRLIAQNISFSSFAEIKTYLLVTMLAIANIVTNNNILRYARTLYIISSSFWIGRFGAVRMGNLWLSERIIYGFANEQLLHAQMNNYCILKWTIIACPSEQLLAYPSEL